MLRSILIALDGSDNSEAVIEFGVRWAKEFDANLVGIGIVDQPTMRSTTPALQIDDESTEMQGHWKEDEQFVEQFLQLFTDKCEEVGVDASTIKDVGPPGDRILLEANRHDVVLISPHFQAPNSAGNTFMQVLRAAPRPIVGVPKELPSGEAILIAYDGSTQASRAMQAFSATGLGRSRSVHVISIDDSLAEATGRCAVATEYLRLHDIEAESHPLEATESIQERILDEVAVLEAGLLVLGAHKQPILKEMFLGSVTKTILNESTVPLFLYH